MTAWWWIILCIGMCAGQSPVLTPANETAAKYKQDKTLTCTYAPFASGNPFQLIFNSFIIYDHTGPAVGKESKYGIEKQSGLVTLTIRDVNISDSGEYVCNMAFKNSLPVNVSVWNEPDVSLTLNQGCPIVTARGIYPHESNLINFKSNYTSFATREVKGNTADSNLFDIVWTSKMKVDAGWFCVKISFDIYGNDLPHTRCDVYDNCPPYKWVALVLFLVAVLNAIVSIIVYASAKNCCVAPAWVMFVMTIVLYVITVWALVMIFLLIYCKGVPNWSIVLVVLSLFASVVSVSVQIAGLSCSSGRRIIAKLFRKMFHCESMDEEERVDLAAVLVVILVFPWPFIGCILLVPFCFGGRFAKVVKMFWTCNVGFSR